MTGPSSSAAHPDGAAFPLCAPGVDGQDSYEVLSRLQGLQELAVSGLPQVGRGLGGGGGGEVGVQDVG